MSEDLNIVFNKRKSADKTFINYLAQLESRIVNNANSIQQDRELIDQLRQQIHDQRLILDKHQEAIAANVLKLARHEERIEELESLEQAMLDNTKMLANHEIRIRVLEDSEPNPPIPPQPPTDFKYYTGDVDDTFSVFSGDYNPFSVESNLFAFNHNGNWCISDSNGMSGSLGPVGHNQSFMWHHEGDKFWAIEGNVLLLKEIDVEETLDPESSKLPTKILKRFELPRIPGMVWYPGNRSTFEKQWIRGWLRTGEETTNDYLLDFNDEGLGDLVNWQAVWGEPRPHNVSMTEYGYTNDPSSGELRVTLLEPEVGNLQPWKSYLEPNGGNWSHPCWDGRDFACYSGQDQGMIVGELIRSKSSSHNILATIPSETLANRLQVPYANYQHGTIRDGLACFSVRTWDKDDNDVPREKHDEISLWTYNYQTDKLKLIKQGLRETVSTSPEGNKYIAFAHTARPGASKDGTRAVIQTDQGIQIFNLMKE